MSDEKEKGRKEGNKQEREERRKHEKDLKRPWGLNWEEEEKEAGE